MASDAFNRADDVDLGSDWSPMSAGHLEILGNECTVASAGDGCERYNAETPADDQEASVTVGARVEVFTQFKGAGPAIRCSAVAHTCYFLLANKYDILGELDWGKVVAGVPTFLGNYGSGLAPVTGDKIAIRGVGTLMTIFMNDVEVASFTDASIASGQCGIMILSGTEAQPSVGNFVGGSLVTVAPADMIWLHE